MLPDKSRHQGTPIFTAHEALEQRRKQGQGPRGPAPRAVILSFSGALARQVARRHPLQRVGGFLGELGLLKQTGGRVALAANFGIGAPAAVALLEELVALGAKEFIAIGTAGGLQPNLRPGDVILCDQALRDEGTSAHYLAPAPYATASPPIVQRLQTALNDQSLPYQTGSSWTTDAPYREFVEDVQVYHQAGILAVEMEAAALFAAGQALGVGVAAAFVVADTLEPAGLKWRLEFDSRLVESSLNRLLDAAVAALHDHNP